MVSYARISADLRKDEHGVQDQHRVNRETASRLGWTVVHEFTDNDKSAAKMGVVRDDFEAMLRALMTGKLPDGTPVRGVVVLANDRLARRPGDYERFVEAFTYNDGFVFADAKGPANLYSEDVESMGLFGVVISKMEVRMRNSHRARAVSGKVVGGPCPFGWKGDRITLEPDEAALLRQAAREFIGGRSLYSIVMEWQEKDVRTPRGNYWQTRTLRTALAKPRMCGFRELDGEVVRDESGNPIVGEWAPILTPEEWYAVRAIVDARKGRNVKRGGVLGDVLPDDYREHRYLLTDILRCGRVKADGTLCNTPLRIRRTPDKQRHIYYCPDKSVGGCGGVARRGDKVDEFVSEAVLAKLEERQMRSSEVPSLWSGDEELKQALEERNELARGLATGRMTSETFFIAIAPLEERIARLRSEKSRADAAADSQRKRAVTDIEDVRRRWYLEEKDGGLPMSTKRTYVREVFHAVIVHPAGKGRTAFNPDLLEPVWRAD
ncbi:recombinase family protein [Actinomadura namibiensis]|uniref:recombinase family protein n=1 Tax=Actinomadura kijaniata TaxID=46161 RepID=UPI001601DA7C